MSSDSIDYSLHYRRWHSEEASHYETMAKRFEYWLSPHLQGIDAQARVLDYGCGFGLLTNFLARRFTSTLGVDASAQQVAVAERRGLNVQHVPVDHFEAWVQARSDAFDVIFLFDVLEHMPPLEQIPFLRRLVSTLAPGGLIFVKVPNASSPVAMRWRYIDWTHWSSFTEPSLDFVCLHAGLSELSYLEEDSSTRPRWPWLPRWGLRYYYGKTFVRALWRLYLLCEVGESDMKLGLNLLVRGKRVR